MKLSEEKLVTKRYYDRNAARWAKERSNFDYCRQDFNFFKQLLPNGKILDLGCGTGRDVYLFAPAGYEYLGVDISEGMVKQARKLFPDAKFKIMDIMSLDFKDQTFDGIWSFTAYQHLSKSDINIAIAEANRVLKMDGIGYITVKKGSKEGYLGEKGSERYWSFYGKNQFAKILKDNGFDILKFWEDKRDYHPPQDVSVFLCYIVRKISPPLVKKYINSYNGSVN